MYQNFFFEKNHLNGILYKYHRDCRTIERQTTKGLKKDWSMHPTCSEELEREMTY